MSANNVAGGYRMGPIFGGMLLSGHKVARLMIGKAEKVSRIQDKTGTQSTYRMV